MSLLKPSTCLGNPIHIPASLRNIPEPRGWRQFFLLPSCFSMLFEHFCGGVYVLMCVSCVCVSSLLTQNPSGGETCVLLFLSTLHRARCRAETQQCVFKVAHKDQCLRGCSVLGMCGIVGTALRPTFGYTCKLPRRWAVGRLPGVWPMLMGTQRWQTWAVAGLATPDLRCYCRFLSGLLPFSSTELWCNPGQFPCRSSTIQCIPLPWQCDCWVTCEDESDEADCPGECVGQADAHGLCFLLRGDGVSWYPLPNPYVILS